MDYSKFQDDNFDVKEWVNAAFKAQKEGTKDQYATTLVMKLQMFIQEVNNVIEESCQQAVSNLPRVMRDLEAVKQEASLLQEQMKAVKYDIQKVEHDTAQSMQTLLQLDTIKSRMKDASDALQEADNWTTLSADVDEVFDSQDLNKIAEKLVGMQQSLHILTEVPDYVERCQYLETLKNRLEATLSPHVVASFSSHSLESAQNFVRIFNDIERLPQLYKYYHKCHKGHILIKWRNILDEGEDSSLCEWLTDLYDHLLSTWQTQMKWCGQVFEDPAPIVGDLITQSLLSLDPSISSCLQQHVRYQQQPVKALIDLKQVTERFAKSMETTLGAQTEGQLQKPYVEKLAATIYLPYKDYIQRYGEYEAKTLAAALLDIPLDHEDVLDTVRLLSESVPRLFSVAKQCNDRCIKFTNGCGYITLPQTLTGYFRDYIKEFRRVLTNLREKCNVDSATVDSDDWSLFQNALRIIQTCGDLILHTGELDQELVSCLVTTVEKYCPPSSPIHADAHRLEMLRRSPFQNYCLLLMGSTAEQRALEAIITRLEDGEMPSVLEDVQQDVCGLSEDVHRFAFDIVFAPLSQQLKAVPTMEVWTSQSPGGALTSSLPSFGLSPLEYITKIGQYLLTLPQQLDPFTLEDSPTLSTALKHSKLPYTAEQSELPEHMAELWLESVAKGTMHNYTEQILKILELTPTATQQLVMDIDYLSNVLEDLGLQTSESLQNIVTLLKASEQDYSDAAENMPQRLTSAVASMRNLSPD